ncbi:MAG: hypothetical protein JST84_05135 [Acidobacteria bacterium]|nr:hypothetical protein [Acidobacteriota bacterium]
MNNNALQQIKMVKVTLSSVTFVGSRPVFTGTDQTGRKRTFTSPVNYSVQEAKSLLNQTIQIAD